MIANKPGVIIKGCTRCQGDMKWDILLEEWSCIQCGRTPTSGLPAPEINIKKRRVKMYGEFSHAYR